MIFIIKIALWNGFETDILTCYSLQWNFILISHKFQYCPFENQANRSCRNSPAKEFAVISRSSPTGSQSPPLPFSPVRTPAVLAELPFKGQTKEYTAKVRPLPGPSPWCEILGPQLLGGRILPGQRQEEQRQDKAFSWHDVASWSFGLG